MDNHEVNMMKGKRIAMWVTISMSRIVIRWVIIRFARRATMRVTIRISTNCDQKDNHKLARRETKS
jgi:hypothetical protein